MTEYTSLYKSLTSYQNLDIYPFHMPGHKRNPAFIPEDLLRFDVTEIPGMDNLQRPEGILLELEEKISVSCKSKKSFISVNGSGGGILAALMSVVGEGDELLLARNSHISAYNGLVISGASPVYVYPQITPNGICGGILKQDIERILAANDKIKAVFLTSPTYEGFCSDIKGIAEVVHKYGKILIIDEAHGAHFGYHPAFPAAAVTQGADISIQSLHKTLPALGQSAVVHVGSDRIDTDKLKKSINLVTTTSPSYILLACIDFLFSETLNNPLPIFEAYASNLREFDANVANLDRIVMNRDALKGNYGIADIDLGKLVFYIDSSTTTVKCISKILLEKYKVQVEATFSNHIIAMTSIADTEQGFLMLAKALQDVNKMLNYADRCDNIICNEYETVEVVLTPRQAFNSEKEFLPLGKSAGKICGEFVVPYPPGIPIITPGELITKSVIYKLSKHFADKDLKRNKSDSEGRILCLL